MECLFRIEGERCIEMVHLMDDGDIYSRDVFRGVLESCSSLCIIRSRFASSLLNSPSPLDSSVQTQITHLTRFAMSPLTFKSLTGTSILITGFLASVAEAYPTSALSSGASLAFTPLATTSTISTTSSTTNTVTVNDNLALPSGVVVPGLSAPILPNIVARKVPASIPALPTQVMASETGSVLSASKSEGNIFVPVETGMPAVDKAVVNGTSPIGMGIGPVILNSTAAVEQKDLVEDVVAAVGGALGAAAIKGGLSAVFGLLEELAVDVPAVEEKYASLVTEAVDQDSSSTVTQTGAVPLITAAPDINKRALGPIGSGIASIIESWAASELGGLATSALGGALPAATGAGSTPAETALTGLNPPAGYTVVGPTPIPASLAGAPLVNGYGPTAMAKVATTLATVTAATV